MTREQAVENGFIYEGKMGFVPVYLGGPLPGGAPVVGVRGSTFWEYVMDAQDLLIDAVLFFKPTFEVPLHYDRRIDGGAMPANEADL